MSHARTNEFSKKAEEALLSEFDRLLMEETGLPVIIADDPLIMWDFDEEMEVIIVFNRVFFPDETRYYNRTWQVAEKQATKDYKAGNIKSAESVEQLFSDIESSLH